MLLFEKKDHFCLELEGYVESIRDSESQCPLKWEGSVEQSRETRLKLSKNPV